MVGGRRAGGGNRLSSQATTIIDLADKSRVELFHAVGSDRDGYATVSVHDHLETHPIRSKGFRRWLTWLFYNKEKRPPAAQAMQDALGVLEARAQHDGPEYQAFIRVAEFQGRFYLDLADAAWRCVEIDADSWRVVDKPPVKFRRRAGMLALPAPLKGGAIEMLRAFLNVENDGWPLIAGCLAAY